MAVQKADIISQLQSDILRLQGCKPAKNTLKDTALGPIADALPNGSFPLGAIHEFLSDDAAAASAFVAGLVSTVIENHGVTVWVSSTRTLFPPALTSFGLQPDHFIFVDLKRERDVLWTLEEALKCSAVSTVIGEVRNLDFTASRRLQLAVEQSQATGFMIRNNIQALNTTACISRWKISSLPSETEEDMPGIGFPTWKVELLRMRNGKTGSWQIQWKEQKFMSVQQTTSLGEHSLEEIMNKQAKTG